MLTRRAMLAMPAGLVLGACGGGGGGASPAAARVIGWYASSLGTGYYATSDIGTLRIPRPPARVLEDLTGATVADFSVPGGSVAAALAGAPSMPFRPFKAHIAAAALETAIFWYGGVEAVLGQPVEPFRAGLTEIVDTTLTSGKRAVLVTNPRHEGYLAALAAINEAIRDVARGRGAALADLWDLPYTRIDGLHPDQPYIDAAMPRVVQVL